MEPKDNDRKKVLFIRMDGSPIGSNPDPELMAWLAAFVDRLAEDAFENFTTSVYVNPNPEHTGEPTEMQELEYLDGTVEGEDHPGALDMIMSAYRKHLEG